MNTRISCMNISIYMPLPEILRDVESMLITAAMQGLRRFLMHPKCHSKCSPIEIAKSSGEGSRPMIFQLCVAGSTVIPFSFGFRGAVSGPVSTIGELCLSSSGTEESFQALRFRKLAMLGREALG